MEKEKLIDQLTDKMCSIPLDEWKPRPLGGMYTANGFSVSCDGSGSYAYYSSSGIVHIGFSRKVITLGEHLFKHFEQKRSDAEIKDLRDRLKELDRK